MRTHRRILGGFVFTLVVSAPAAHAEHVQVDESGVSGPAYQHELLRNQWFAIEESLRRRKIDEQALETATAWRRAEEVPPPVAGREGRVVFRFGTAAVRVVCAPLRICDIELQPGEAVQGEPHAGDDERWDITPALSGITQHVVIKPLAANIATNIAIYTDRRVYHIELQAMESAGAEYMPYVSFSYPDDQRQRWLALMAEHTQGTAPAKEQVAETAAGLTVDASRLSYRYRIKAAGWFGRKRRAEKWAPKKVFDDGRRTLIQMPEYVRHRELPMLVVRDGAGNDALVNTSFDHEGLILVVDRLFDSAVLVLGAGRNQERVEIARDED